MATAQASEFIMRCFHARTNAHVLHLKTRSYAAHKALNEFYDGIVGLVDSFAETYIGEYGLIESYPPKYTPYDDGVKMLTELGAWIEDNRDEICDSSFCQNLIDEVCALIYSTRYKLQILK